MRATPNVAMTQEHCTELADSLETLWEAYHKTCFGWQGQPGSDAVTDVNNDVVGRAGVPWGQMPARTMQTIIGSTSSAMLDHLYALAQVLRTDIDYAPMILGRSALEAAGRIAWMIEPGLDTKTRVIRCYAFRLRGLQDSAKNMAAVLAIDPNNESYRASHTHSQDRVAEVLARAHALKIPVHLDDAGNVTGLKTGEPTGPKLIDGLLRPLGITMGALLYGHWSSIAHSTNDALLQFLSQVTPFDDDKIAIGKFATSYNDRAHAGLWTHAGVEHAMQLLIGYYGFDDVHYNEATEATRTTFRRLNMIAISEQ